MTPHEETLPVCRYCGPECVVRCGYCHCQCGGLAPIATKTTGRLGHLKGLPTKFISGHNCVQPRPDVRGAAPFKIDGIYCRMIPLTQRQWTIVWASHFDWLMQWNWQACWNPTAQHFYAWRGIVVAGKHYTVQMARVILGMRDDDERLGDHINGVTLDNRYANLRPVSYSQSTINQKTRVSNRSGRKGVSWHEKNHRWAPSITDGKGTVVYLGEYEDYALACSVRAEAEKQYYGDYLRAEHGSRVAYSQQ